MLVQVKVHILRYLAGFHHFLFSEMNQRSICILKVVNFHVSFSFYNLDQKMRYEQ